MSDAPAAATVPAAPQAWPDLRAWNLYFLSKVVLAWMGALNLHILPNLLLLAVLLVPLRWGWARIVRNVAAFPAGVALYYHDTWWPPFGRLLAQREGIGSFSLDYLLELLGRFINVQMTVVLVCLLLAWWLLKPWVRMTTLSVAGMLVLVVAALPFPAFLVRADGGGTAVATGTAAANGQDAPASSKVLDNWLDGFYRQQAGLMTTFPPPSASGVPFDVILLNICSMSWSDLDEVGLRDNELFDRMDLMFDNFNSVTSYSGPAGIRLLRASCGQTPHQGLYATAADGCYLFENLKQLGFQEELAINHPGTFQGYLGHLSERGGLRVPPLDISGLPRAFLAFDNTPTRRDGDVLGAWLKRRQANPADQVALFYDTNTMHDGNRVLGADGRPVRAGFRERAEMMMGDMLGFIDGLEKSGRRAVVVVVPEHGAALHGDRMQIPGMREIPSPSITHVPVGVKLVGMGFPASAGPQRITAPSSYLAISELLARIYAANGTVAADWEPLLQGLPQTPMVSENEGAKVINYAGKPWLQLKGQDWTPYPEDKR